LAGSRKPGSVGVEGNIPDIEDGTLARSTSPPPGPIGTNGSSRAVVFAKRPTSGKARSGLPTLRQGARGQYVRWLQIHLNELGTRPQLKEDGVFGPKMLAVVISFQRSASLRADGVVGSQTWLKVVIAGLGSRPMVSVNGTSAVISPAQKTVPRATTSVADWPLRRRFEEVLQLAPNHMAPELAAQFRAMLTPLNVSIAVGTLAAWAVSHAFGVGEIADIVLGVVGAIFIGMAVFKAGEDIGECLMTTLHAQSYSDLDKAADYLAQAVAIVGVVTFFALLAKVGAKLGKTGAAGEEEAAAGAGQKSPAGQKAPVSEEPAPPESQPKPAYKANGDWDASRDWEYAPKQTGRVEPGAVPDTPDLLEAQNAAISRTAPPAPDGWPELPDNVAKTFGADAQPVNLPEGTKLYRVIASDNGAGGSYWSTDPPPATEGAWRASSAVTDEFNGDGGYVQTTVPRGGANVWSGPTAPQPAGIPGNSLPGGGNQIWVPRGTFIPDGPPQATPWNSGP
jgi:hypothetical protein